MISAVLRCRPGALLTSAALLAFAAAPSLSAAQIWERATPFQACIESRYKAWQEERAALVVNEDPKAGDIDDASVAKWVLETFEACHAQAGAGDKDAEARFAKHMARWREHIDDRVQAIQERVRPD